MTPVLIVWNMGYHRRATSHGRAFIGHVGADSFTLGDYPRGIRLKPHMASAVEVPDGTLDGFSIQSGMLTLVVKRTSATLLGREVDEHRYRVSELPNWQVLVELLEQRIGSPDRPPGSAYRARAGAPRRS